jgi:hypothetical protein
MPRAKRRMTAFSNAQAVTPNQNWNTRKTFHTSPLPSALPSGTFNFVRVNKLSENVCRIFIHDVVRILRHNVVREELNWHPSQAWQP